MSYRQYLRCLEERQFWRWLRILDQNEFLINGQVPTPFGYYSSPTLERSELFTLVSQGVPGAACGKSLSKLIVKRTQGKSGGHSGIDDLSAEVTSHRVVMGQYAIYRIDISCQGAKWTVWR